MTSCRCPIWLWPFSHHSQSRFQCFDLSHHGQISICFSFVCSSEVSLVQNPASVSWMSTTLTKLSKRVLDVHNAREIQQECLGCSQRSRNSARVSCMFTTPAKSSKSVVDVHSAHEIRSTDAPVWGPLCRTKKRPRSSSFQKEL